MPCGPCICDLGNNLQRHAVDDGHQAKQASKHVQLLQMKSSVLGRQRSKNTSGDSPAASANSSDVHIPFRHVRQSRLCALINMTPAAAARAGVAARLSSSMQAVCRYREAGLLTMVSLGRYPVPFPGSVIRKRRDVNRDTQLYTSAATSAICNTLSWTQHSHQSKGTPQHGVPGPTN